MTDSDPITRLNAALEGRYLIESEVGRGGMGVVYKALDPRLGRHVALKLLSTHLTRDAESRTRFIREAQTASALDHPNICTIHEIDETEDGQLFIAMALYDGHTLREMIAEGPLSSTKALEIGVAVARGLAKAHEVGIIHRDIKPANIVVTQDGQVKILDFGVAKLRGAEGMTRTGSSTGTLRYMAPELFDGTEATPASDVWALGAVLFEALTGELVFEAESQAGLLQALVTQEPRRVRSVRDGVATGLDDLVARALAPVAERYQTADQFLADTERLAAPGGWRGETAHRPSWRQLAAVAGLAAVVLLGVSVALRPSEEERWARTRAMLEIEEAIDGDAYGRAFELATRAEPYLDDDPLFAGVWAEVSWTVSITSSEPAVEVRYRPYTSLDGEWRTIGETPVRSMRMPVGAYRVELVFADGTHLETALSGRPGNETEVHYELGTTTRDSAMVHVAGGVPRRLIYVQLPGVEAIELESYQLDRYEVTNGAFLEFVQDGGYTRSELWGGEGGPEVGRSTIDSEFVDATDRPGPATWSVGTFAVGMADYPVAGVSWHEARAYCRWSGKTLPTVYHWVWAANLPPPAALMSNYGGVGTEPVGSRGVHSIAGAHDMAGNVREWVLTGDGLRRFIMGGSFADQQYQFAEADQRDALDRAPESGFRCMKAPAIPQRALAPLRAQDRDYRTETPVPTDVYRAFLAHFEYDRTPLNSRSETVEETPRWTKERITYSAAYDDDVAIAYLWTPKNAEPPFQTVVMYPGSTDFLMESSREMSQYGTMVQFFPLAGRAVLYPIYKGTYERKSTVTYSEPDMSLDYRDHVVMWTQDLMRGIDYLESREDIDVSKLAYFGYSWGGELAPIMAAVETRLSTAVLAVAGFPRLHSRPEVDPLNYAPHVTIPTLMLGGQLDYIFPLETSQRPMFELLGTPLADKRFIEYEGTAHNLWPLYRNEMIRQTLDWLDRYLGPVGTR